MDNKKIGAGLFLIILGGLFLLVNLGYISFNIFFSILDLWPLLLVVAGVNIIFNKRPIVALITWIIFFIILILYGSFYGGRDMGSSGENINTSFFKLAETSRGKLDLDIGAAKINIASEKNDLLKLDGYGRQLDYEHSLKNDDKIAIFDFANKNFSPITSNKTSSNYNFKLNENVIWDLDLNLGAISGILNLKNISVESIDLDIGAGDLDIILGDKHDSPNLKINGGVSNLSIAIPKTAGIKIKLDGALNKTDMDNLDLDKVGDYYISPNYEEKDVKIDFYTSMGVGKIKFKVY